MERAVRSALAMVGLVAALLWAGLFLRAPGASLEMLLLASPIIVAIWLITTLTAPARRQPAPPSTADTISAMDVHAAVLARDLGTCSLCHAPGATRVVARRPARAADPDPLDRFLTLCESCAATSVLAHAPA